MRRNPFLDFQVTAERAGYPALLFVSLLCLALVLVPFLLLALTQAVWVLVLALLSLSGAVAILFAGIGASLADRGDADLEPPKTAPEEHSPVAHSGGTSSRPRRTGTTGRRPSDAHGEDAPRRALGSVSAGPVRSAQSPLVVVPRGSKAVRFDDQGSTSPRRIA
jgi:hypothetical protein